MTIDEKLSFFQELINCNYKIYLWSYTAQLELIHTNCPAEIIAGDVMSLLSFSESLMDYVQHGGYYPFILETALGLLYIAGFEYDHDQLARIHIIGPAFTGKNSHLLFKKELDQRELSVRLRPIIFRQIEEIPIIPSSQLFQYGVMLHYCITGEHITSNDIQFPSNETSTVFDEIQLISGEHRGIWLAEQALMQMFRDGNPDYKKALEKSSSLSSGVKLDVGDSIRQQKNSVLSLLTLCSRASIEGGLNPSISYTLNDYYAQQIEFCKTTSALTALSRTMMDDYIQRVRDAREDNNISRQIQSICDHITMHPKEKFSIAELAAHAGYTQYYFSHKFKKEMGVSVADYIRKVKVEQARLLLCGTQMTIQEISDELAFGSRSYFATAFQKETGLSPSEYRAQNLKY